MKEKIIDYYIMIIIISTYIIRFLIDEQFPARYRELIYLFLILVLLFSLYRITKEKYSNMLIFFSLTFLFLGLLPYFHYLNYSSNKENYSFNNEYISQNIKSYKENLKKYKDSAFLSELKSKFHNKDLNIKLDESEFDKKQLLNKYTFLLKRIDSTKEDERSEPIKGIYIYRTNQEKVFLILKENNLKEDINLYLIEKNILNNKIKNPKQNVPFNDIWLDSVTGFIFSFIKPLSKTAQIIRLSQLLTAFFWFYMISSWLKLSKTLNISENKKFPPARADISPVR